MRSYELVIIISPQIEDSNTEEVVGRVGQLVSASGGEVAGVEPWGRRRLTYPIKGFREGSYVLMNLKLEPSTAPALERSLALVEEVIRHLLVRLDKVDKVDQVDKVVSETKGEQ